MKSRDAVKPKGRADPIDVYVGARLRKLRKGRGLSPAAVAGPIGVTFQQLLKYETGKNRISASTLYRLSLVLRVDIAAFFDGLPQPVQSDPA